MRSKAARPWAEPSFDELAGMITKIMIDWRVPQRAAAQTEYFGRVYGRPTTRLAVLISSVEQADLKGDFGWNPRQGVS